MMGAIKELSETTDDVVGKEFWFEYHCFESPKSCDAELWYRTHNKVLVLSIVELGCGDTKLERLLEGCPRVYRVVFEDGFEYDVFEDELMESKEEFERPDAPKNLQESIRRILKEETNRMNAILRRVPHDDLEREFKESLNMSSNMLLNLNRNDGGIMTLKRFIDVTTSVLMDGIHYEIYSTMPLESQWYDEVIESLKKHYKHRIGVRYNQLIKRL